ncbi:MAG: SDR family oxidoreductase [Betaproteobacteria bacterium]|nr:SDR family oxidoreductase [Betaproteobacteria bacterium]MSQ88871.1 SDR family oxidoreductase [Betaproteobacteria bacterium]
MVGALGVIGRYIVEKLASLPDWQIVGLSRRRGEARERLRYLSVDLLDPADTQAKLSGLGDATHVFYAAFQAGSGPAADYAKNIDANRDMLVNSVSAIERVAPGLERVVLVTGTKYYGSHLGPFKTPAREDDARHAGANYYFDQIDWLTSCQRGKRWSWAELRPQTLCGFAPGTAMSIVPVIAVYAAILKELGQPLAFPGTAWESLYQVTESAHFANAALWAATESRCAGQAYNITNGDNFRWRDLWPKIAEAFDMPAADPKPLSLVSFMNDKAPLWDAMAKRHGLKPYRFDQVVAWPFGDYVFSCNWDVMTNLTKSRQHGFHEVVDSEEMFVRLLRRFRNEKIVP